MISDLTGLAAYTQWQTREIDYKKYRFWVKSSKGTNLEAWVERPRSYDEDDLKNELEEWVERVFPMFHFTDAFVRYGWE